MNRGFQKIGTEGKTVLSLCLLFSVMAASSSAIAGAPGFDAACTNVRGFFENFEWLLKLVSISIVTIAIVFAGYQIAFAHKRLSDVAPVLIGGLLIGGASAIAGWFTANWTPAGAVVGCGT
ncbi:TrbC/VirB2 family protein [Hydrogenophaga crassostreae]|nr:TrbC/VirB2 family protein [Hydrogenophaga crassostreae]